MSQLKLSVLLRPLLHLFRSSKVHELPSRFFTPEEIGRFHQFDADPSVSVDDQTWHDLLLEEYEEKLAEDVSIFGRQELHRRLRVGLNDDESKALRERIRDLMDDPARITALQTALRPLRQAETEVADLLFGNAQPRGYWWSRFLWILPLVFALSICTLVTLSFGWTLAIGAFIPLIALQIQFNRRVETWNDTLESLDALLGAASGLTKLNEPLSRFFLEEHAEIKKMRRRLARSLFAKVIPGANAYLEWFGASNIRRHFKTSRLVFEKKTFLRKCFIRCAAIEADVALARHLCVTDHWCWAERTTARALELVEGVHPLMEAPAALSTALNGRGAFISGQNASGKSTYLRMIGINLVAARAFGFCYAKLARLPAVPVRASMQNEDSLLGGESLYMAELRRAHELLDAAGAPAGVCLIDEVFRGTNHLESVSAAAAVLEAISERDLVLVSSHNLILARVLRGRFTPFYIDIADCRPRVLPGILSNPNGVALLAKHGFSQEIEVRATEIARWLAEFMAEPHCVKDEPIEVGCSGTPY